MSDDYFKTLENLLYSRLDSINETIKQCNDDNELYYLHKQRDQVMDHVLVFENKVKEIKINGVCYRVIG